jgi:hypothetical protein
MVVKATGAISRVFSVDWGEDAFGTLVLQHWDAGSGFQLVPQPGTFTLHPARQEHEFAFSNGVAAHEDVFVLNGPPHGDEVDPPAAYYRVHLRNGSQTQVRIASFAFCQVAGMSINEVTRKMRITYDRELGALLAWDEKHHERVRVFGCSKLAHGWAASIDHATTVAQVIPSNLTGPNEAAVDNPLSAFQLVHSLAPGEETSFAFLLSFSGAGREDARRTYHACPTAEEALARTERYYSEVLDRAQLSVPNEEINKGVLWAKVNMLRTEIKTPTGWAFTNDPGNSTNAVARDTAWFSFGADYLTPAFSREALLAFVERQEEQGMVVEYYNTLNNKTEDLGLNINDDTPLLILGLWHHYAVTGDRDFLEQVYPAAVKAAEYILSQRNDQGLVWCTATETGGRGIIGWRNVIKGYRLSGATTEVNSECFAALDRIARMARLLGDDDQNERFRTEAAALKQAINTHLFNPDNGLYYLNIDVDGRPRTDVTSDLVFPVMFDVAPQETATRIVKRLTANDFWAEAGIRVVPRNAPSYSPDHGYGLLGGVWVGVSFWLAFAAARVHSYFLDHALDAGFRSYARNPRQNNTVPGQFSEWLHGETLVNQGMMLSPWFPPRYLWAAIEGAAGIDLTREAIRLTPQLAPQWTWLCVRNLPLRGEQATWLVARMPEITVFSTTRFEGPERCEIYPEDVTAQVEVNPKSAVRLGLRREGEVLLFAGNTGNCTTPATMHYHGQPQGNYRLRTYDSLDGQWRDRGHIAADQLSRGLPMQIERQGFCLLTLKQEQ